jgi:hypothetical protein
MPEACLALETACCFGPSVAVTRFMIQDEMGVRNSPTDNCLVGTQFALAQLACICSCAAWLSGNDAIACALRLACACMCMCMRVCTRALTREVCARRGRSTGQRADVRGGRRLVPAVRLPAGAHTLKQFFAMHFRFCPSADNTPSVPTRVQAQHYDQLELRDAGGVRAGSVMMAPQAQQMTAAGGLPPLPPLQPPGGKV